jgi:orotate phosphoribosyltransferase
MAVLGSLPAHTPTRDALFKVIQQRSFTFGEFTLSSGKQSDYYLDMKPTMFDPEGVTLLAELVLERIEAAGAQFVGGLEMGAVPLVASVVMLSRQKSRPISGFFVRKEPKTHGTGKLVEAPRGALKNKNVVILDDVTTEGGSAMKAVAAARDEGANVVLVLSIVDREDKAAALFKRERVRFDWLFKASEFRTAARKAV